jgi:hypothetical protein
MIRFLIACQPCSLIYKKRLARSKSGYLRLRLRNRQGELFPVKAIAFMRNRVLGGDEPAILVVGRALSVCLMVNSIV